jgi:hypothetical protein
VAAVQAYRDFEEAKKHFKYHRFDYTIFGRPVQLEGDIVDMEISIHD